MDNSHTFRLASSKSDFKKAKILFLEYAESIAYQVCFDRFEKELQKIEQLYTEPEGRIIVLEVDNQIVGCAGLRNKEPNIAELKRMYIQPAYRGKGRGRQLLQEAIGLAKDLGYRAMQLDTLPAKMPAALKLYKEVGFQERHEVSNREEEVAYYILEF